MISETKSNWDCVAKEIAQETFVSLSLPYSEQYRKNPFQFLSQLTVYKFAGKMFGGNRSVINYHPHDSLGAYILSQCCVSITNLVTTNYDCSLEDQNLSSGTIHSQSETSQSQSFNAFFCLHINPCDIPSRGTITSSLEKHGMFIISSLKSSPLSYDHIEEYSSLFKYLFYFELRGTMLYPDERFNIEKEQVILACELK